ncbi:Surface polysaccharide O-acyltransferase, integral membrane enzyme [Chryseobacterium sp. RU37D]|uniref:acyltransferase family protein n=1 Tax=Chryseobacterium sp. RU37D TaxID=1907397 RepID=UPI0009559A95|nr:acyltransferase family protein [Chryseobacterium sp. RU37D]SIQ61332.1 Surface polysaccharide O-acyltransferase, integral membrane enzyme [Chryseobacterium sp. RU37D]
MRNLSIDILKIVLAFFVVFLHMHLLKYSYPTLCYLTVNGLFRIAVPVFLIITGYYFYYIDNSIKLKKWAIRTFLLYTIWTIIYIPFWRDNKVFPYLVFGYYHLWYLIGTFLSGLVLYFLRKKSAKTLILLSVIFFSLGYMIQLLGCLHYFKGKLDLTLNSFPYYRNFLFACFPFLTIGFLIQKLNIRIMKKNSYLLVMSSTLLVILEAYFNYKFISAEADIDLLFSLLIACPILFLFCKNITIKTDSKILASLSTAIYLVHPLLMGYILRLNIPSFKTIIFIAILIGVSLALVFVNKKVKYLL